MSAASQTRSHRHPQHRVLAQHSSAVESFASSHVQVHQRNEGREVPWACPSPCCLPWELGGINPTHFKPCFFIFSREEVDSTSICVQLQIARGLQILWEHPELLSVIIKAIPFPTPSATSSSQNHWGHSTDAVGLPFVPLPQPTNLSSSLLPKRLRKWKPLLHPGSLLKGPAGAAVTTGGRS